MIRLSVLFLLALASGVFCGGPGGPKGKMGGPKKKMMPPINANCNDGTINSRVQQDIAAIDSNDLNSRNNYFNRKAEEIRKGRAYFNNNYNQMLQTAQTNICVVRRLRQRAMQQNPQVPSYCSQMSTEQLYDCPSSLQNVGDDMLDWSPCEDMDVGKEICKLFQNPEKFKKIEKWIVEGYMEDSKCSDLNQNTLRATATEIMGSPERFVTTQMSTAPTLETAKMHKECVAEFIAQNMQSLGTCEPGRGTITSTEVTQMQAKPAARNAMDTTRSAKDNLLNTAMSRKEFKKFICLMYYKHSADRSQALGISMGWFDQMKFGKALKNVTKSVMMDTMMQTAQRPSSNVNRDADNWVNWIRNGQWSSITMPSWMTNGQTPTMQQWKDMMDTKVAMAYKLYTTTTIQNTQTMQNFQNFLNRMFAPYTPPPQFPWTQTFTMDDPKKEMMKLFEQNKDTPQVVLQMIKAKVDAMMAPPGGVVPGTVQTLDAKKLMMFKMFLLKYVKEMKTSNVDCPTLERNTQGVTFTTVANDIINRNWASLKNARTGVMAIMKRLDPMVQKQVKYCIVKATYDRLGQSTCTGGQYTQRQQALRTFIQQLENNQNMDKKMKMGYIKTKLMQTSMVGPAPYCDMYFLVSASTQMTEDQKLKKFGMKLMMAKMMLWKYDTLTSRNFNPSQCPRSASEEAFDRVNGWKPPMFDDWMMDDDDDYEDDEGDDDDMDDDMDDGEDYDMSQYMRGPPMMRRGPPMMGGGPPMMGGGPPMMGGGPPMMGGGPPMMGGRPPMMGGGPPMGHPPMMGGGPPRGGPPIMGRGPPRGGPPMEGMEDFAMMIMKGMKMGMEEKMMCQTLTDYDTCVNRLTCTLLEEKDRALVCTGNDAYQIQNINQDWQAIRNNLTRNVNFDLKWSLTNMLSRAKLAGQVVVDCVKKDMKTQLAQITGKDACAVALMMQKMDKMMPPPPPPRPPYQGTPYELPTQLFPDGPYPGAPPPQFGRPTPQLPQPQPQNPTYGGNGQGRPMMPPNGQPMMPPNGQPMMPPQRFFFNNRPGSGHPRAGSWNRQ